MRSDLMCTANAYHDVMMRALWCGDCVKWHFRLSLRQRLAPSSRQWRIADEWQWDQSPEDDEVFPLIPPLVEREVRDLQRLFVELEDGVQRLF